MSDGRVKIIPERYAKGYLDWLGEKRDWPVGRQLWWGHQIPIWTQSFASPSDAQVELKRLQDLPATQSGELAATLEGTCVLHVSVRDEGSTLETTLEKAGYQRQSDVLDTWFSSALWPHSTLGWPEKTAEMEYFYPTNTLITSRDIITLWVARMVLMSLNNVGKIPFKEVFIHPKILDGYGETMSKSKGNGVDPIDVIDKFGPDALRYGLCWLATDTQDVRMPVQFECPHCATAVNQTKQNREQPSIECPACHERFSTQWAKSPEDRAYPKAPVTSERFDVARNFCNKLWNAARFVMINLEGFTPQPLDVSSLPLEDRWILSRLSTTTSLVTQAIGAHHYSEASRLVYDFAWDEFCSYYVEMAKPRLQDPAHKAATQQVLAHTLDQLLRLLQPMIPFITEAIWQELSRFGNVRTLAGTAEQQPWLMKSAWPTPCVEHQDTRIEEQFSRFVAVLGALREIRSRQNIPPKEEVTFTVGCDTSTVQLLQPMLPFFEALAGAKCLGLGSGFAAPDMPAQLIVDGLEVTLDLGKFIDVPAEIERNHKLAENFAKQIVGKQGKLSNESFVARAPADVVAKEREGLLALQQQLDAVQALILKLRSAK